MSYTCIVWRWKAFIQCSGVTIVGTSIFFYWGGGRLENGKVVISKLFYNSIESNIYLIIIQHTPLLSYIIWPWVFEKLNLGTLQTLGQYYCSTATAWPRSKCLHTSTTTHNIEPVWKPASRLAYVKLLLSLFKKICNQYMELSQNGMEWGVLGSEDRHCVHTRVFKHFEACFDAAIALYMGV